MDFDDTGRVVRDTKYKLSYRRGYYATDKSTGSAISEQA